MFINSTTLRHMFVGAYISSGLLLTGFAHAEGALKLNSFGVNRRVVPPKGYVMVSGRFKVEQFVLPKSVDGKHYVSPSVSIPGTTLIKPVNSKPTFYLGAEQEMPCEAGFQFESGAVSGTVGVDLGS